MNDTCKQVLSNEQYKCEDFAAYITNPESVHGHSYPEIYNTFSDVSSDEEIQVSSVKIWSQVQK